MIEISFYTNLDLFNEVFPDQLQQVPRVGDLVESRTIHSDGFQLKLRVVSVTWRNQMRPLVELHAPNYISSITEFYNWYAPLVGKRVSYFI